MLLLPRPVPLPTPVPLPVPVVFWIATALVIVGQVMILRSTVRAMRGAASASARRTIEWSYAIVPAAALVLVLLATYRATEHREIRVPITGEATS